MAIQNKIYLGIFLFVMSISTANLYAQGNTETQGDKKLFETDFKEKYSGRKFNYEGEKTVGNSKTGSGNYTDFKNDEKKPKIEEEDNENNLFVWNDFAFLNWLFILALVIAVLYLVYILLGEQSFGLFKRNGDQKIGDSENFTTENIADTDLVSLIKIAEQNNDYRLAIRYYYILVLKHLSLKNYIKLEEDKTNAAYYEEIISQNFSENFAYTSYLYNYIWYGEFLINNSDYHKAKDNFIHLIKKIER